MNVSATFCKYFMKVPGKPVAVRNFIKPYSSDARTLIEIPKIERKNESIERQRARLLYQSRKRGMLENGLLFSTFADKYLNTFTSEQLTQYDRLINDPSNDWDIYYWLTGKEEPPIEFNNEIFRMLQEHTQNKLHEQRYRQPDIKFS